MGIFSRSSSTKKSISEGIRNAGHSRSSSKKLEAVEYGQINDQSEAIAKRNMDEDYFASGLPKETPALSDKLESHRAGSLFKYAVITNAPSDERTSIIRKLRSYKPQSTVDTMTLDQIPPVRLIGDCITMNLSQVLDPSAMKSNADYISVDCILIHFIPLDSFANDKSVVTIQLNDLRKVTNTIAREAHVDNTMGYNILFFLDYCVEKVDMRKLTLSFSCGSKEFQPTSAWGAVKVIAQLQLRSFPIRLPLMGTTGVMLLSDTDLERYDCDPRGLDLVVTAEALKKLQEAFQRGEIENRTVASSDKRELNVAKTVVGPSGDSEDVGSVIERMAHTKLLQERQAQAQIHNKIKLQNLKPSEIPLKSAMKMQGQKTDGDQLEDVVSDNSWQDKLEDIRVGEDNSSQTIELNEDQTMNARKKIAFNMSD